MAPKPSQRGAPKRASRRRRTMPRSNPQQPSGSVPLAIGRSQSNPSPRIAQSGRITTVSNSESLLTLTSAILVPGSEIVGSVPLSVRNPTNLPWLNQVGPMYSKYRFRSLSVTYEPYCPTTSSGQICMVMVYDENDINSPLANSILQTAGNIRTPVWQKSAPVKFDSQRAAYPWYYSKQNPASTTIANLSVPAWLLYSAFSSSLDLGLGRVMCHYVVEFCDPIAPATNQ